MIGGEGAIIATRLLPGGEEELEENLLNWWETCPEKGIQLRWKNPGRLTAFEPKVMEVDGSDDVPFQFGWIFSFQPLNFQGCIADSKGTCWVWWRMVRFYLTQFFCPRRAREGQVAFCWRGFSRHVPHSMLVCWEYGRLRIDDTSDSSCPISPLGPDVCLYGETDTSLPPSSDQFLFEAEPKSLICRFFGILHQPKFGEMLFVTH